jgi:hypothetical protein
VNISVQTYRNRLHEANLIARRPAVHDQWGSGSVMVWPGISYDGHMDLHVFMNGSVTGQRYSHNMLFLTLVL